jgi:formate/nitrite transporter FocA (FNT family)
MAERMLIIFEHCIANLYFIPVGIFLKDWAGIAAPAGLDPNLLNWGSFLWNNLLPVTIGNVLGGGVFVGMSYWGAYLRPFERGPEQKRLALLFL